MFALAVVSLASVGCRPIYSAVFVVEAAVVENIMISRHALMIVAACRVHTDVSIDLALFTNHCDSNRVVPIY